MRTGFAQILVGWDGSTAASAGLKMALRLAADEGGQITALAVVPGYEHVEDQEERQRAIEDARIPLQDAYDALVRASEEDLGPRSNLEFVEAANVVDVLDSYTTNNPIDLVVVGLHGREGLLHPRMGHVASHAVRASRCPVLVVPDPIRSAAHDSPSALLSGLFHPFRHRDTKSYRLTGSVCRPASTRFLGGADASV